MNNDIAPALSRGIGVIRLLAGGVGMTLEELARHTAFPRSSLLRILEVLTTEGIVERLLPQKQYRLLQNLLPVSEGDFEQRLEQALAQLAAETGQTAEFYLPFAGGMTIVARREATEAETGVKARIGFVRDWIGELDAVNAVGTAFFRAETDIPASAQFYAYAKPGVIVPLHLSFALTKFTQARNEKIAIDRLVNKNNVRRIASVVMRGGQPYGVIALAEVASAGAPEPSREMHEKFLRLTMSLRR